MHVHAASWPHNSLPLVLDQVRKIHPNVYMSRLLCIYDHLSKTHIAVRVCQHLAFLEYSIRENQPHFSIKYVWLAQTFLYN